jgi:hypothetical protein
MWAVWLCFLGVCVCVCVCVCQSHTVLCVSNSTECADWLSFGSDLIRLVLCAALRCTALRCDALSAAGWVGGGVVCHGVTRWLFVCRAGGCT